jgi:hypothetical protein
MARQSDFTKAVLNIQNEVGRLQTNVKRKGVVPFMQEEVSNKTARDRFQRMSPEERLSFMEQTGPMEIMKMLRVGTN